MSIRFTRALCIGCGACTEICPGSLLALDAQGKAFMAHPENCWGCASCLKECPVSAIALYLGADMGGLGGTLRVRREGTRLLWTIQKPDGTEITIPVDSREANHY
ncbi:MAG: ferredoxin family protein [Oscillospiraceae bacterium]|jgi:adenylylsulfate reductase subunit B|nr:ferredoxin family protein [Oscillospiraceae bacterium]